MVWNGAFTLEPPLFELIILHKMGIIRTYSEKGPDDAFADFEVDYSLIEEFEKVFHNKNAPIIEIITDENRDYLLRLSKEMRNGIRGKDIGGLG